MQFHTTGSVLTALTVMSAASAQATQAVEWKVSEGGNGHWYEAVPVSPFITWPSAAAATALTGGHLVTITDAAEGGFVRSLITSTPSVVRTLSGTVVGPWIGAVKNPVTLQFEWATGEPWSYTEWAGGEPTGASWEDRICYYGGALGWNDRPGEFTGGTATPSYVIEWSADCNADGIVDYGQILSGELADANSNGVPDCCDQGIACNGCIGDLDDTGEVDAADIGILLLRFGRPGVGDLDGDGIVTAGDISVLLLNYGPCSGFTAGLPTVEEVPPLLAPLMPEPHSPVGPQRR